MTEQTVNGSFTEESGGDQMVKATRSRAPRAPRAKADGPLLIQSKFYEVVLDLTEPVLGTVPKSKEIYKQYIQGKLREMVERGDNGASGWPVTHSQLQEELETVEEVEEKGWTGFHQVDGRPMIYDYYVKSHLKDVALNLGYQLDVLNFRSKVENFVFVQPRKQFFEPHAGKELKRDVMERPLRATTMQGPRVTLARSDILENAAIRFRLEILKNKDVTEDLIIVLFQYGLRRGFGQGRTGGWGRYELRDWREIEPLEIQWHGHAPVYIMPPLGGKATPANGIVNTSSSE